MSKYHFSLHKIFNIFCLKYLFSYLFLSESWTVAGDCTQSVQASQQTSMDNLYSLQYNIQYSLGTRVNVSRVPKYRLGWFI